MRNANETFDFINTRLISQNKKDFKYIQLVSMVYLTLLLAATIVAYRVVKIGPFPEPGSTLIYTISFFIANVYTEVYGPTLAKRLIWESIFCGYLFAFLLSIINGFPAPDYWDNTDAYNQVLGNILRFTNAGVMGYLLSATCNIYLMNRWRFKFNGRLFWVRSLLASSLSEGVATFAAGLLTFLGLLNIKNITLLMTSALAFKLVYGVVAVGPASFLAFFLKKAESS